LPTSVLYWIGQGTQESNGKEVRRMDEVIDVVPEKVEAVPPTVEKVSTSPVPPKPTPLRGSTFRHCVEFLLGGRKMRRQEWPDDGTYVVMRDEKLMIYKPETKSFHSLILSTGDMSGEDWVVISKE